MKQPLKMPGVLGKAQRLLLNLRTAFFNGPAVFNYPGKSIAGYRSVNLMLAHWIHAFSVIFFTPAGRILSMATLYFLLGGMLTLLMPIYFLSLTLTSLFLVDIIIGWYTRPRLDLQRFLPETAAANVPIRVDYFVRNIGRRHAWDVIVDAIPFPSVIRLIRSRIIIKSLAPGECAHLANNIVIRNRGYHLLPLPFALSSFPFGLSRWGSSGPPSKAILIYPDFVPLRQLHLPPDFSPRSTGDASFSSIAGQSMEFLGCREFRDGDNPRYIHAPAWARLQKPVVKEFADEHTRQLTIFIDTLSTPIAKWRKWMASGADSFEASLSLITAAIDYLTGRDYRIELYAINSRGFLRHTESPTNDYQSLVEFIAALDSDPSDAFPTMPIYLEAELGDCSAAIGFFLNWDESRRQFMQFLSGIGIAQKTIVIRSKSAAESGDDDVIDINAADIVAGNVTEL